MIFSLQHKQVLKAFKDGATQVKSLSERTGFPESLVSHLLVEMKEGGLIKVYQAYPVEGTGPLRICDIVLLPKGEAAIEAPDNFLDKPMNPVNQYLQGDYVARDKVMGDKVMGDKTTIKTVQGDAIARNKIINNSQNLTQAAQDIKALLDQLAIDYPDESPYVQAGRAIDSIKNDPILRQQAGNAIKEAGTTAVEKAIEAVTDNPAVSIVVAGIKSCMDA
jgi:hypothetical protein